MNYRNFITNLLSERQSDLTYQTFVRDALVQLQTVITDRFDALFVTLEKIVSGQSSAGDFETERNDDVVEQLKTAEHPKAFLAQRAMDRLSVLKTTRFYENYHRFLFMLKDYPGVKFTVKFGEMEGDQQVSNKTTGQYDVKYSNGQLERNRYDQVITVDENISKFEKNFGDIFETYQYLTYVRIYFPDDLQEERDGYYDGVIDESKYIVVNILDEVKVRNVLYHEFRHAYDMMKIGTAAFNNQKLDDEGKLKFDLPSESELETIRRRFLEKGFATMSNNKIGYFISNHERNAFTTGVLSSLHEFLDSNYKPNKTPRELLYRFLSNFPHNKETMVVKEIADSTGDFKRFMGRLWTFVTDYIKGKSNV